MNKLFLYLWTCCKQLLEWIGWKGEPFEMKNIESKSAEGINIEIVVISGYLKCKGRKHGN